MKRMIKKLRKNCQSYFDLIEEYKAKDGGYNHNKRSKTSHRLRFILVYTLYQDLNKSKTQLNEISKHLGELKCKDASFANDNDSQTGVSSATAAGIIMTMNKDIKVEASIAYLMKNYTPRGGFKAAIGLPIADVLSTSTALLALYMAGENLQELSENLLILLICIGMSQAAFLEALPI